MPCNLLWEAQTTGGHSGGLLLDIAKQAAWSIGETKGQWAETGACDTISKAEYPGLARTDQEPQMN